MLCGTCGTSGTGTFCAACGARLNAVEPDPADTFWGDDEPTLAQQAAAPLPPAAPPESSWEDWLVTQQPASPPPSPGAAPFAQPTTGGPPGYGPPPPRGGGPGVLVAAAVVAGILLLTIGGGTAWLLTSRDDDPTVAVGASTSTSSTVTVTSTPAPPPPPPTTTTTVTTTSAPASAADQLADLRDESLGRLVTDDRWAVSLSAKQDGTRDERQLTGGGSHVFRLPDILELHRGIEVLYSGDASVYLLKAEDLGSTAGPEDDKIWMTIVDPGLLDSRDDAETWCAGQFPWLDGDDLSNACYPRQLTTP